MKILGIGSKCKHSGHDLTVIDIDKTAVGFQVANNGPIVYTEFASVEADLASGVLTVEQV